MDSEVPANDHAAMPHLRGAAAVLRLALLGLVVAGLVTPLPAAAAPVPSSGGSTIPAAAPGDARIRLSLRASGLSKPVTAVSARDGTGRVFIVEQTGRIKIIKDGVIRSTPFLSLTSSISRGYEQGLLGLAFHPDYRTNRKLYVNFTNTAGDTVIREYRACAGNPNVVCTSTARRILRIDQPYANHNGGTLAFGPDGYLYIGMGDGGSANDPGERGQSLSTLLGKMLRIDVNGTTSTRAYRIPSTNPYVGITGLDEIWQTGLRNPYRFSFDRVTGDLWIGDVGQNLWEEVDRARRSSTGPGRKINWGWDDMEGRHCFEPASGCSTTGKTLPVAEYGHTDGRCSVTGGFVYRGAAVPALVGGYVFADYCTGEIWVIDANATAPAAKTLLLDTPYQIAGFGENGSGELYVLHHCGAMYVIVKA